MQLMRAPSLSSPSHLSVVFFILLFRWPVTYNLRNCLRRAYAIAWGSLRGVWFLRGVYASLRCLGFAYAAMPSCCFRLCHEALEAHHEYHN